MKHITIISGNGGTGKTTIAASFAALAHNLVMIDGDVDAADLHLLLNPHIRSKQGVRGSKEAVIDEQKCTDCRLCLGHDILFSEHSEAPVTTFIVKDRVLAHNTAGAIYSKYYRRKFRLGK